MTDYTELKRLAEAAKEDWPNSRLMELAEAEVFIDAANPTAILALIAENERLAAQVRLAGVAAEMTVHDAIGRAANDYLLVCLERDQLKAEVEALRKDACRWSCVRNAIPMQSPYAVWREGSHVVLGKDADDLVDNFLLQSKEAGHD